MRDHSLLLFIILQTSDCIKWPQPPLNWPERCESSQPLHQLLSNKVSIFLIESLWLDYGPCSLTGNIALSTITPCTEHFSLLSLTINVIAQTSCPTTISLPLSPDQASFPVSISTIFRFDKISRKNTLTDTDRMIQNITTNVTKFICLNIKRLNNFKVHLAKILIFSLP